MSVVVENDRAGFLEPAAKGCRVNLGNLRELGLCGGDLASYFQCRLAERLTAPEQQVLMLGSYIVTTTGFSPMNQTGLPCQTFEVALGRATSISERNESQIAQSSGDCALAQPSITSSPPTVALSEARLFVLFVLRKA